MTELSGMGASDLLSLHGDIVEELRARNILRSMNNPTGDLAEHLCCTAFGWKQAPNSERGYDATDANGTRYQIKARRVHRRNPSRQLSALRELDRDPFDILVGVLFDERYRVLRAALIPLAVVAARASYVARSNSHRFLLRDLVWDDPAVTDITDALVAAMP